MAHHAGATLVQSIGDVFAVGATLKFVRGIAAAIDDRQSAARRDRRRRRSRVEQVRRRPRRHGDARSASRRACPCATVRAVVRGGRRRRRHRAPAPRPGRRVVQAHSSPAARRRLRPDDRGRPAMIGGGTRRSAPRAAFPGGGPVRCGAASTGTPRAAASASAPVGSVGVSYPVYRSIWPTPRPASDPETVIGLGSWRKSPLLILDKKCQHWHNNLPPRQIVSLFSHGSRPSSFSNYTMPVRIGELLLKEKRITPEQLQEALNYQKANGGKLGVQPRQARLRQGRGDHRAAQQAVRRALDQPRAVRDRSRPSSS